MNLEELFENETKGQKRLTEADRVMLMAESEFSPDEVVRERVSEKEKIVKLIQKKIRILRKYKNVKNHRKTHINNELAKKRHKIRKDIEELKLRLSEIGMEEEGSRMDTSRLF